MSLKQLIWIILFLGVPLVVFSQNEIVFDGADLNFQTTEDYKNYEGKILILIDWLTSHSLLHKDWKKGEFVFSKWLKETPFPAIFYRSYVYKYTKENPKLLVLFLAGWTDFVLRNPKEKDNELKTNLAGINVLLDYYQVGEEFGIKKDKRIEKLIQKKMEGKLEKVIQRKVNN